MDGILVWDETVVDTMSESYLPLTANSGGERNMAKYESLRPSFQYSFLMPLTHLVFSFIRYWISWPAWVAILTRVSADPMESFFCAICYYNSRVCFAITFLGMFECRRLVIPHIHPPTHGIVFIVLLYNFR